MSFLARQLGYTFGLSEASFEFPAPGLIAIVGPNGAGKSTLVSIMAGLRRSYTGSCTYGGKELRAWRRHELARRVAFLPQSMRVEFPFTAEQVVFMGRTPHANGWYDSPDDLAAVDRAMETTDTIPFRARDFRTLSGGERQRVILASALAQEPEALLLDEPTTFLDLRHQIAMYRLLAILARQMLIVTVTHDLNLALRYAHRVIAMDRGKIAAEGKPGEVLTPENLERIFGVAAKLHAGWIEYDA